MFKEVALSKKGWKNKGKYFAIVDADIFDFINQWDWTYDYKGYAYRRDWESASTLYMHVQIMNPQQGLQVDHINGNGLDNRKENLNVCEQRKNAMNRPKQINNTSGFKGVKLDKRRNKWVAYIRINQKEKFLGYFEDKIDAALAYDEAAKKEYKYAGLNFPGKNYV